jgi:hypothetical protein
MDFESTLRRFLESVYPEARRAEARYVWESILEGKTLKTLGRNYLRDRDVQAVLTKQSFGTDYKQMRSQEMSSGVRSFQRLVANTRERSVQLWSWLSTSKITFTVFQQEMQGLIDTTYEQAYRIGAKASGSQFGVTSPEEVELSSTERDYIDSAAKEEKRYLKSFLQELKKNRDEKTFKDRFARYLQSVEGIYRAGLINNSHPYSKILWVANPGCCPDCLLAARLSPYTKFNIPWQPKSGFSRCLNNCKCRLIFKDATPEEVIQITADNTRDQLVELLRKNRQQR